MDEKKIWGILALIGGGSLSILINFTAGLMFIIIIVLYIGSNKKEKKSDQEKKSEQEKLSDYRFCILVLLARVMSADGRQMKCELDVVKSAIREYYVTGKEQEAALKQFQSL